MTDWLVLALGAGSVACFALDVHLSRRREERATVAGRRCRCGAVKKPRQATCEACR